MATRYSAEENEAIIRQVAYEVGVDPDLAVAIALVESNLDNTIGGDGGHSWGLFQLNDWGMGYGMSVEDRQDPWTNARIALASLAQTQAQQPGLDPGSLAAASQRPADRVGYAVKVNRALAAVQARSTDPASLPGAGTAASDGHDALFPSADDSMSVVISLGLAGIAGLLILAAVTSR